MNDELRKQIEEIIKKKYFDGITYHPDWVKETKEIMQLVIDSNKKYAEELIGKDEPDNTDPIESYRITMRNMFRAELRAKNKEKGGEK